MAIQTVGEDYDRHIERTGEPVAAALLVLAEQLRHVAIALDDASFNRHSKPGMGGIERGVLALESIAAAIESRAP